MSKVIRGIATAMAATLALTALSACGGSSSGKKTLVVGSADFAESATLAEVYAQALEAKGFKVDRKLKIGSREVYYKQVADGKIQVFPEYNGNLLLNVDKAATAASTSDVDTALANKLPSQLGVLNPAQAEDKDAVTVNAETAQKYNLKSITDLVPVAKNLVVGGPPEFKTRESGLVGLKNKYGVDFKEFKSLDTGGPITIAKLKSNDVQVADVFSTDSSIVTNKFVVLDDPKNVFPAQNVIPLIYKAKVPADAQAVLNAISAKLTTQDLLNFATKSDVDKATSRVIAKDWLKQAGLA